MRTYFALVTCLSFAVSAAAQSTVWVGPAGNDANPGTLTQPFLTINHANAVSAPGTVIRLLPGTYGDEQGSIILGDKAIEVVGSGADNTVLRAHSTLTTNIPTGFPNAPVPTQQRAVVLVQGSARVDLRGFTIDGNFSLPASGRLTGVYYRGGADGELADLVVRNCRSHPINASQGPAAIVVRGDGGLDACNVTVRNCELRDWGKVGAAAFFAADLDLEGCRIVGADHTQTGPAQNGVQFGFGAGGAVRGSTIADVYYDPASYVAAGILAYDASGSLVLEDNGIANCEHAIYFFGSSIPTLSGLVRRNRVLACDAGVYLDGVSGVTVHDNHLQLSLDLYANAGFDNTPGNVWAENCYSSYPGTGTHTIPGGAGAVDGAPRRGVDLFDAPVVTALPAGHFGRQIAVAELDGLPGVDFATVDEGTSLALSIGHNVGGSFSVVTVPFATSGRAVAIVAAELNNSPGLDLAVLLQVTTPVPGARLFTFANDGSGNFTSLGSQTIAGSLPTGLAAGDLSGDGIAELVATNVGGFGGGDAILFANNGPVFGTNYSIGLIAGFGWFTDAVRGVALVDLTNDGRLDVVVTEGNQTYGRVHVFANLGFGFAPTGYSPVYVPNDPTGVAAGDLDGDGDPDLLVSYGTSTNSSVGGVAVLENLTGGMFRTSFYRSDYSTNAVVFGDIDGNGAPGTAARDAAIVNTDGGTVTVLGNFVHGVGFSHGGIAVDGMPACAVAFGDANGDGFGDLFYTNGFGGQVVVLPGHPSARACPYGVGTAGFRGRIPTLSVIGAPALPTQPNLTLGFEVGNGFPFSIAGVVVSLAPAPLLLPDELQVDLAGVLYTGFLLLDADGRGTLPFGLPGAPSIHGMPIYCQAGVCDGFGTFSLLPGCALSRGLELRVGR